MLVAYHGLGRLWLISHDYHNRYDQYHTLYHLMYMFAPLQLHRCKTAMSTRMIDIMIVVAVTTADTAHTEAWYAGCRVRV